MKFSMSGVVRKQLKVLYAVIVADTVNMMDNLFRTKIPAEFLLHNKTVLKDVSFGISKRMIRSIKKNVSVGVMFASAVPSRITATFKVFASPYFFFSRLRSNYSYTSTANFFSCRFGVFKAFMCSRYSLPVCLGKMFAFRPGDMAFISQTQFSFMLFCHHVRHRLPLLEKRSTNIAVSQ